MGSIGEGIKGSDSLFIIRNIFKISIQPWSSLLLQREEGERVDILVDFCYISHLVQLLKIIQMPTLTYQALC